MDNNNEGVTKSTRYKIRVGPNVKLRKSLKKLLNLMV
jgi:hypothetical protein